MVPSLPAATGVGRGWLVGAGSCCHWPLGLHAGQPAVDRGLQCLGAWSAQQAGKQPAPTLLGPDHGLGRDTGRLGAGGRPGWPKSHGLGGPGELGRPLHHLEGRPAGPGPGLPAGPGPRRTGPSRMAALMSAVQLGQPRMAAITAQTLSGRRSPSTSPVGRTPRRARQPPRHSPRAAWTQPRWAGQCRTTSYRPGWARGPMAAAACRNPGWPMAAWNACGLV